MIESSLIPEGKRHPFLLSGSSEVRVTAAAKKSVFCSRTLQQNRWVQASRSWTWALELKDSVPLHHPPHNKSTFRLSSHQLFSVCSLIVTLSSSQKMKNLQRSCKATDNTSVDSNSPRFSPNHRISPGATLLWMKLFKIKPLINSVLLTC